MATQTIVEDLAIDGGPPAIDIPLPPRGHFGEDEKAAAMELFDRAIATGTPFGYNEIGRAHV